MLKNQVIYHLAQAWRRVGYDFHEDRDSRVKSMREAIRGLGSIRFDIEGFPDGTWVAQSTNVEGIITGGADKKKMNPMLKDAIFTYYGIPPQLCNDGLVRTSANEKNGQHEDIRNLGPVGFHGSTNF